MKASCHRCGREYLVARKLAGTTVVCRGCGAHNDGAGGPPPAQPVRSKQRGRDGADDAILRERFEVGADLPLPEPPPEVVRTAHFVPPAVAGADAIPPVVGADTADHAFESVAAGDHSAARLRPLGILAALALLALVATGVTWVLLDRSAPSTPAAIADMQRGVPQVVGDGASASGFIVEEAGELWLVTDCRALEATDRVDVLFRDPKDGAERFRLPGLKVGTFRVHNRFMNALEGSDERRRCDLAAICVEDYRPQIERLDVEPFVFASPGSMRSGDRVLSLGHPITRTIELGRAGDPETQGVAFHTLQSGVVSALRPADNGPTVVSASVRMLPGLEGGPLVSEADGRVLAVAARRTAGGSDAELSLAIVAEHALEVIRRGIPVESLRDAIEGSAHAASSPDDGGRREEESWPSFDELRVALEVLARDGWRPVASNVVATDEGGRASDTHTLAGAVPAEMAVIAYPRDAAVEARIESVVIDGRPMRGYPLRLPGSTLSATFVIAPDARIAGTIVPLAIPPGARLELVSATEFAGSVVSARLAVIYLERSAPDSAMPDAPPPALQVPGATY